MKMKYLPAAALLLGLASCSNNETETILTGKSNEALFRGSIEGVHSRAYDQTWEATDKIGISGTSGDKEYTNVCYSYAGNSGETFTAAGNKIYYQNEQPVEFTAYYPWDESLTAATTLEADTWKQQDQKTFDFLYAQASGSKEQAVDFTFTHQMTKLVLIVKAGTDMTYDDVESAECSLGNFRNKGTFDRTDGKATATGATEGKWTFANNKVKTAYNTPTLNKQEQERTIAYTLILFPQTFSTEGNLTFAATTGGNEFTTEIDLSEVSGNDDANELKPGTQYNITINLNKTGLTVGKSDISKWNEVEYEINAGMSGQK